MKYDMYLSIFTNIMALFELVKRINVLYILLVCTVLFVYCTTVYCTVLMLYCTVLYTVQYCIHVMSLVILYSTYVLYTTVYTVHILYCRVYSTVQYSTYCTYGTHGSGQVSRDTASIVL